MGGYEGQGAAVEMVWAVGWERVLDGGSDVKCSKS